MSIEHVEIDAAYALLNDIVDGQRVLDFGEGGGAARLAEAGTAELTVLTEDVAACRANLESLGYDGIDVLEDTPTLPLPFADGDFDIIVCPDLGHRLRANPNWRSELRRVLHADGYLLVGSVQAGASALVHLEGTRLHPAIPYEDLYERLSDDYAAATVFGQSPLLGSLFFDLEGDEGDTEEDDDTEEAPVVTAPKSPFEEWRARQSFDDPGDITKSPSTEESSGGVELTLDRLAAVGSAEDDEDVEPGRMWILFGPQERHRSDLLITELNFQNIVQQVERTKTTKSPSPKKSEATPPEQSIAPEALLDSAAWQVLERQEGELRNLYSRTIMAEDECGVLRLEVQRLRDIAGGLPGIRNRLAEAQKVIAHLENQQHGAHKKFSDELDAVHGSYKAQEEALSAARAEQEALVAEMQKVQQELHARNTEFEELSLQGRSAKEEHVLAEQHFVAQVEALGKTHTEQLELLTTEHEEQRTLVQSLQAQATEFQAQATSLQEELEAAVAAQEAVTIERNGLAQKLGERINGLEAELQQANERTEALSTKLSDKEQAHGELDNEIAVLRMQNEQIDELQKQAAQALEQADAAQTLKIELEQLKQRTAEFDAIVQERDGLRADLRDTSASSNEAEQTLKEKSLQLESVQAALDQAAAQITALQSAAELSTAQAEQAADYKAELERSTARIAELEPVAERVEQLEQQGADMKAQLERSAARVEELEPMAERVQQLEEVVDRVPELQAAAEHAGTLQERVQELEEEIAGQRGDTTALELAEAQHQQALAEQDARHTQAIETLGVDHKEAQRAHEAVTLELRQKAESLMEQLARKSSKEASIEEERQTLAKEVQRLMDELHTLKQKPPAKASSSTDLADLLGDVPEIASSPQSTTVTPKEDVQTDDMGRKVESSLDELEDLLS